MGLQDLNAAAAAGTAAVAAGTAAVAAGGVEDGCSYCMEAAGTVWSALEFTLLPQALVKGVHDLFGFLPHLLWAVGTRAVMGVLPVSFDGKFKGC